jgi:hypothetical protein
VWSDDQGTQVVQLVGDFRCDLGSSHLRARDAVMWLKPAVEGGRRYVQLEFFLWQDASVVSPGGAVVEGATLFATAATYGGLRLAYDRKAVSSAAETSLFQDAQRVRQASAAGMLQTTPPPPLSTLNLRMPEDKQTQITFSPGPKAQILDGEWVATLTEGVYFSRGTPGTDDFLEGSADAAVLFAVPPTAPDQPRPAGDSAQPQGLEQLRGIYLEGDVVLQQALRSIRAERLFVDLENSKALILDPVVRVGIAGRTVPVYVRAREARQLSKNEVVAQDVKVSTSEFYTPHFYIGAEELFVTADGPGGPLDSPAGTRTGSYRIEGGSLNVGGLEGPPWVTTTGDIGDSQLSLRGARISNSNDFGFSLETKWDLFKVVGQKKPESVRDADLLVDMYTDRGVGVGVDSEYENDVSFGLMRGYFIYDLATRDDLGPNRADEDIQHPARGRATWRHRQYLPDDWQLTVEASYMSDQNFLEEYFENEFENDKPQETYFQLKKQRDNWALTILEQVRINNWLTQTESLPDLTFRLYGAKLGPPPCSARAAPAWCATGRTTTSACAAPASRSSPSPPAAWCCAATRARKSSCRCRPARSSSCPSPWAGPRGGTIRRRTAGCAAATELRACAAACTCRTPTAAWPRTCSRSMVCGTLSRSTAWAGWPARTSAATTSIPLLRASKTSTASPADRSASGSAGRRGAGLRDASARWIC